MQFAPSAAGRSQARAGVLSVEAVEKPFFTQSSL